MFQNRGHAGKLLSEKLRKLKIPKNAIIVAIPRGGVVVGDMVAKELGMPLSIVVVKKIGSPENPELAIGAVAPEHTIFWDEKLMKTLSITEEGKKELLQEKEQECDEREKLLNIAIPETEGKMIAVVDDGVATGSTVIVAALFLRKKGAEKIILAVPVIAKDTISRIKKYFDRIVYLEAPLHFYAVGEFYDEFPEIRDEHVLEILKPKSAFS